MRIGIVGGALQGLELTYLCKAAGYEVVLADLRPRVPAAGLCDRFVRLDTRDFVSLDAHLAKADVILPALESRSGLAHLSIWADSRGVDLIHDSVAFDISASKINSDVFFRRCGVTIPSTWPECRFPVIAKPSGGSGSQGIRIFITEKEMRESIGDDPTSRGWAVQEFLYGPTFSVEVIRHNGRATAYQVTDLHMDQHYDCKRVTAPSVLEGKKQLELQVLSTALADSLNLEGIMDVEVVLHHGQFYILEIDARFPSQTPIAVYQSNQVNLAASLIENIKGIKATKRTDAKSPSLAVVVEHIQVTPNRLRTSGEHIIAQSGPLSLEHDFFGADEALTDYHPEKQCWVATLICTGSDSSDAWQRREQTIAAIQRHTRTGTAIDPSPDPIGHRFGHDPIKP